MASISAKRLRQLSIFGIFFLSTLSSVSSSAGFREWIDTAEEFWTPRVVEALSVAKEFWCLDRFPGLCSKFDRLPASLKKGFDAYAVWSLKRLAGISKSQHLPPIIKDQVEYYAEVFKPSNDPAMSARANRALERIRPFNADPAMRSCYSVTVLDANVPNAFNTGCHIFVTSELMKDMQKDEEVSAVFAHEMSHGDYGHAVKNVGYLSESLGHHFYELIVDEMDWLTTGRIGNQLTSVMRHGNLPVFLQFYGKFGPRIEIEADVRGVLVLKKAGIDPANLKQALIKLHMIAGYDLTTDKDYDSLRDYPSLKTRLEAIDREIARLK